MKSKFVICSRYPDEKLKNLYKEIEGEMSLEPVPPPGELIGDMLLLLYSQHRYIATNDLMWRNITHGRRWKNLKMRIMYIRRLCERSLKKSPGMTKRVNERTEGEPQKSMDIISAVLKFVTKAMASRLMRLVTTSSDTAGDILENIAEKYAIEYEKIANENKDYSQLLIDTYVLVMVELVLRARSFQTVNLWINHELVLSCLEAEYDQNFYKPRQLRIVTRMGDEDEKPPGDYLGIRGVTKKIREDQIPKILPSVFAPWMFGDMGKKYTLDTVINRNPPCYQHFDTKRPEISHRILLTFIVGVEKRGNMKIRADITGKTLAFNLLVNAGLKVPHNMIQTDVAWFEYQDNKWLGNGFPLHSLSVTNAANESWRNLTGVDRMLPNFFVRWVAGTRPTYKQGAEQINSQPCHYLMKAIEHRIYQAVFLVVIMREEEKELCLPPASIVFPCFDRESPTVMVCCTEDAENEIRNNSEGPEHKFQGDTFRGLMAANVAPFPLPDVEETDLIKDLMAMIIGPMEQHSVVPTII